MEDSFNSYNGIDLSDKERKILKDAREGRSLESKIIIGMGIAAVGAMGAFAIYHLAKPAIDYLFN